MHKGSVLVVDDERSQREILRVILEEEDYEVILANGGKEALKAVREFAPDIILTDLKMPDMDGLGLLDSLPKEPFLPPLIIMTAHGSISSAVEAMKKGAFNYLTKPLDKDELLIVLSRAFERLNLMKENYLLQQEVHGKFNLDNIIGSSDKMREVFSLIEKVSSSSVTVLLCGESGTGKELVAKAIHYNSPRKNKPLMAINCAAIPENLIESELFGYEIGAFTGATTRKLGIFETSNGGTLFLDEIGDLSLPMQSRLLRVLQEKEIRRVGGRENIKVDVRLIAATNKILEKEIQRGSFRDDLYYRLTVVTINIPPLRERKADIPRLAQFFLEKYNMEFGKRVKNINSEAMRALLDYDWPGNVRELESAIERAVLLGEGDTITMADIAGVIKKPLQRIASTNFEIPPSGIDFEELEKNLLVQAMDRAGGVIAKAAKLLGMSYKTFWYRWEKFGLDSELSRKEETAP